jgi:hypothetical protein
MAHIEKKLPWKLTSIIHAGDDTRISDIAAAVGQTLTPYLAGDYRARVDTVPEWEDILQPRMSAPQDTLRWLEIYSIVLVLST